MHIKKNNYDILNFQADQQSAKPRRPPDDSGDSHELPARPENRRRPGLLGTTFRRAGKLLMRWFKPTPSP